MGASIILPYPHPGQQAIRRQARRFNWLAAGRRWRKTTLVMSIAVEEALRRKKILWGAPTFDQVRIGWNEAKKAAGAVASFVENKMLASFPTGGSIVFRSLDDPDNARGHTADGIVIDEVADVKEDAWYDVLRPTLIDTEGWAWFIGTPRGHNWFWRESMSAVDRDDSMAWQVPTLGVSITENGLNRKSHPLENPTIPFDEIERIWHTTPERTFRQEILAEFVDSSGGVFRGVLAAATATPLAGPEDGHTYIAGVDWARTGDFSAIAVLDATEKRMVALDRFNQIDYHVQLGRLRALHERFCFQVIIAEANSMGTPLIETLQRDDLPVQPFTTTNASKAQAMDALALAFERGEIRILNDPTLLAELQAYEQTRTASGMLRYSAPAGMHDDCVMALALAWQAVAVGQAAAIEYGGW